MPCGPKLIEEVYDRISKYSDGLTTNELRNILSAQLEQMIVSDRAIRYAIAELIKSGRARRDGQMGPVYAVRQDRA